MFGQKKPSFQPNVKIIDDDQHILYELTNGYELENFILNKNLRSISSRYHPDKYNSDDHSPEIIKDAARKFIILYELFNEFKALDKTNLGKLVERYRSVYTNSSIPNGFGEKKGPAPKQTEYKPIDPIKPEDKKFFDSFKRNYYEKSTAFLSDSRFNEKELEQCFISFRDREYKKFTKSKNQSGVIEFKNISTFDKTTYESYIFFPDQPNPETPCHDQVILESYKQAVRECQIAKPNDLTNPEKPSQDKAGDEYTFLMFKDAFIKSYTDANQNKEKNTNKTYLTDRLKDRIQIFTGKKTKDYIEPKSPSIKEGMSILEYDKLKNTYEIKYAEYEALNSIFDRLCRNDDVKKFLAKEKTKYEDEKKLQDAKAAEAKKAEERELKERENSLEGRWHSLTRSLFELKENASSTIADVSSSIADASSKIGSSLGSAPSAVHGFSSNFAESAKERVDSLAIEISTSATKTFTEFSSTAMAFLTSMKLPEINLSSDKTNAPENNETSDKTNAPENTETSHKQPEEKPADTKKERCSEDPRPESEASERARARAKTKTGGGAEKAKEVAEKAKEAAKEAEQAIERAKRERAAKKDITPPTSKPPRSDVAFFGPRAQCHDNNKKASQNRSSSSGATSPSNRTSPRRMPKSKNTKPQEGKNHQ